MKDEKSQTHTYSYYTNDIWSEPKKMTTGNTGLEALNKIEIDEEIPIFNTDLKVILYFQSFGLLVINGI